MDNKDIAYMKKALKLAKEAAEIGEVPVGAIVVNEVTGEVLSSAYNLRESTKKATAHAELLAIEEACRVLGTWRLSNCTLYVTLEPCPMCAGAIVNSRISRVVYGASDRLAGCIGSVIDFNSYPFNHSFKVERGICEDECKKILQDFFAEQRNSKK